MLSFAFDGDRKTHCQSEKAKANKHNLSIDLGDSAENSDSKNLLKLDLIELKLLK